VNVFEFRNRLIDDYKTYVQSFLNIRDRRINEYVSNCFKNGYLWPEALIQMNPSFEAGDWIAELVQMNYLHPECQKIFRIEKKDGNPGKNLRLHKHQSDAIKTALKGQNYVLSTGTGSGKSLTYIIPIVDYILKKGSGRGIQAIIVYPMNALANSQIQELDRFIKKGYSEDQIQIKYERYTGQESIEEKHRIISNPPDILLTNYVMLELILTRTDEKQLINAARGLRFLVIDELHTYRGRQGADVAYLIRRVRQKLEAYNLQCVGTSATLATEGTFEEQQTKIAQVASQLFGDEVKPENVIGETLKRITHEPNLNDPEYINSLKSTVIAGSYRAGMLFTEYISDPLACWIESDIGLTTELISGKLIRQKPKSISGENGAGKALSRFCELPDDQCEKAIQECLLASYTCEKNPENEFPPFAFRLHQFISKGDTLYASIEDPDRRFITIEGQQYVPDNPGNILLPLVFCRECGQEYYVVQLESDSETGQSRVSGRELSDLQTDAHTQAGFLFCSKNNPWPQNENEIIERLPEEWLILEDGKRKIRRDRKKYIPQTLHIRPDGIIDPSGQTFQFIPAPFKFCLECEVSYNIRQRTDFMKLNTLSSEGRSTATTILSLSAIRYLKKTDKIDKLAQKLLSFTDNRQDASLQAGHFNDFIEVGWLRAGLYKAVTEAGDMGISHDEIAEKVLNALNLPLIDYAINPNVNQNYQKNEINKAFRNILGYRIYRDLKRGWRITSPNLEQCGLLEIIYEPLNEICKDDTLWAGSHHALASASGETREYLIKVLLDYMRRELAIKVDYLDQIFQERIQQQSNQHLIAPWAVDEDEKLEHSAIAYPRPSNRPDDYKGNVYLSARGGIGLFLRRKPTFPEYDRILSIEETEQIISQLFSILEREGVFEIVDRAENDVPGYQLKASVLTWRAGDGSKAFHDPIRVPNEPVEGGRTNPFFKEYYRNIALSTFKYEAREHTAQVMYEEREKREKRFRKAELPILFCSPTMELGVDIAELNAVNMRNVPPTPANYAQRSGRAGRSGQPALVFSYCSTGSSHDQFFFKRPQLMVSGTVAPPRLDLANEDLVRAHVHAIWLSQAELNLGKSLKDILELSGDDPSLELLSSVKEKLEDKQLRLSAIAQAEQVLHSIKIELEGSDWYTEKWLSDVFKQLQPSFESSCERWRELYRSARAQAVAQTRIILDTTRSMEDKRRAERLRKEAESQLNLLTEVENVVQSDFYSYRYFASEGFLPGYNFPRLPISAFIPGRHTKQRDEFLSRPRFLAISEFGPQAVVYHEGSKYIIHKVILPMRDGDELNTVQAKLCSACGYLHPEPSERVNNNCEVCNTPLNPALRPLLRLQNVATKRRDRINSDEEERMRLGYDLLTAVRFRELDNKPSFQKADIRLEGNLLGTILYGHTATIWRINLGWRRRKNQNQYGFIVDKERGFWERNENVNEPGEDEPFSRRTERVIPFVEDRRNSLIFTPATRLSDVEITSLQYALKNAIQIIYQLEDNELAAEPLPGIKNRSMILFYEAAEGGAGVLRMLVKDRFAFAGVARKALEICHFNPDTGEDLKSAPNARENCVAACYDCLLNYGNQREHNILDRHAIHKILMQYKKAEVHISPSAKDRSKHLEQLLNICESELEREWLRFMDKHNLRLPDKAQYYIAECQTRPDFVYWSTDNKVAIYVDGPPHEFPERETRDRTQEQRLDDLGILVVRFSIRENWLKKIEQYPNTFGKRQ